jgi:predicted esterase
VLQENLTKHVGDGLPHVREKRFARTGGPRDWVRSHDPYAAQAITVGRGYHEGRSRGRAPARKKIGSHGAQTAHRRCPGARSSENATIAHARLTGVHSRAGYHRRPMSHLSRCSLALLLVAGILIAPAAPAQQPHGLQPSVVFGEYSPLFGTPEIVRRLLSPLAAAALHQTLSSSGKTLSPYPIDLRQEKFVVYVPPGEAPPAGFALLVFVPPWNEASMPPAWSSVFDRDGVVFVSAARSGNSANVLDRRVPLAIAAAENIVREYPIDPRRVYIGGFSGGSRVALRIALGYADVFRGALLNAGSDPLGGRNDPLPSRDLFDRFQSSSRLLYVTGEHDELHLGTDGASLASMGKWCVFNADVEDTYGVGHELMSSGALARALARLLIPPRPDPTRLAACRSNLERTLDEQLRESESLIASGGRAKARRVLLELDERFGGLAAPRSVEVAHQCACGLIPP